MSLQFFLRSDYENSQKISNNLLNVNLIEHIELSAYEVMIEAEELPTFQKQDSFWCDVEFNTEELLRLKDEIRRFIEIIYKEELGKRRIDSDNLLDILGFFELVCIAVYTKDSIISLCD
jgi:hypothetical protein